MYHIHNVYICKTIVSLNNAPSHCVVWSSSLRKNPFHALQMLQLYFSYRFFIKRRIKIIIIDRILSSESIPHSCSFSSINLSNFCSESIFREKTSENSCENNVFSVFEMKWTNYFTEIENERFLWQKKRKRQSSIQYMTVTLW